MHVPSDEVIAAHGLLIKHIRIIVTHIASCLALWPPPTFDFAKGIRRPRRKVPNRLGHVTTWVGDAWRCDMCYGTFRTPPRHKCPGETLVFNNILKEDRGHRLWGTVASDGTFFMFCNACGCGSTAQGRGLVEACRGPVPGSFGVTALKRIKQGKHPWKKLRLCRPWKLILNPGPKDDPDPAPAPSPSCAFAVASSSARGGTS